jgi:putative flippase GtrA
MTHEVHRIGRFLLVGCLNTGFGYLSYATFLLARSPPWVAVSGATLLGCLFNFISYGGLVFGDTSRRLLPRYVIFYVVIGGLNVGFLRGLGWAGIGPLLGQTLLLPFLAVLGYAGMKTFVFRGQPGPTQS